MEQLTGPAGQTYIWRGAAGPVRIETAAWAMGAGGFFWRTRRGRHLGGACLQFGGVRRRARGENIGTGRALITDKIVPAELVFRGFKQEGGNAEFQPEKTSGLQIPGSKVDFRDIGGSIKEFEGGFGYSTINYLTKEDD